MLLREDRLGAITAQLDRDGRVVAADLAAAFEVPVDMIRRDLRDLAARGDCKRVYGGALRKARPTSDAGQGRAARSALAAVAATFIGAGQVVYVDSGRVNLAIVEAMPAGLAATVVTASPAVAAALVGRTAVEVIVVGGRIEHATGGALGALAVAALADLRFDLCLLGVCAVAAEGLSAFHIEDAALKRRVVAASGSVLSAVTADKVGTRAPFPIGPIDLVDRMIVEAGAPAAEIARLRDLGVELEIVDADVG